MARPFFKIYLRKNFNISAYVIAYLMDRKQFSLPPLYPILNLDSGSSVIPLASRYFQLGLELLQLRGKALSSNEFIELAGPIIAERNKRSPRTRIIINDRLELALSLEADGVHLGQDDASPASARVLLGPEKVIGFSTHTLAQLAKAQSLPVQYLGFGPVFSTASKDNPDPEVGLSLLQQAVSLSGIPLVAIGGINTKNAAQVYATGAASVAVISDLAAIESVESRVADYLTAFGARP